MKNTAGALLQPRVVPNDLLMGTEDIAVEKELDHLLADFA
jgi:hypothetical protein